MEDAVSLSIKEILMSKSTSKNEVRDILSWGIKKKA